MDIGFIHIGMMKTASTYMQNIWMKDNSYSLSWKGNIPFLHTLRDSVKKDSLQEEPSLDTINVDIPYQEGQKLVISNEGFSTGYLNDAPSQQKMPQFIDYASRSLGRLSGSTPNVLLVVRDPITWIKSIYVQSIKQGSSGSAQDFIKNQYGFLRHSLDLEHIVHCYKRYFNNVLIIPYELLKTDESLFWGTIAERFQVPHPEVTINHAINTSLDLKRTFLLSKTNEISSVLLNALVDSKDYTNMQEKNQIVSNYGNSGKWVHRRFVEYAADEQVDEMYRLLGMSQPREDFFDVKLPRVLKKIIEANYIGFLREYLLPEFQEYADFYDQNLQQHFSN